MPTDEARLVAVLEARLTAFERQMAKANGIADRGAKNIERRFVAMDRRLAVVGQGLARSLLGPLAALASAGEIGRAADAFTRIQNALKVVGLEGEAATQVFDQLFAAAQRNAAPIESLVELYSRAALVQNELNVSSEELLRFTEGVAAALRVSGKSAQESSGALLQLSQALGSGVVRAEEFNSILEGALPIAQAAARGLEEAGGSVAKLRTLVIEGKVSSEAFFRAFEAGQGSLETLAATADTTLGQAFTRFQNQLIGAVGRLNDTFGASKALSGELDSLGSIVERVTGFIIRNAQAVSDIQSEYQSWLNAINGAAEALGRLTGASKVGEALGLSDESSLRISRAAEDAAAMQQNLTLAAALADKARASVAGAPSASSPAPGAVSLSDFASPTAAKSGGSKKSPAERFAEETQRLKERTEALRLDTQLLGQNTAAIAGAQAAQDLLNAAQRAGIDITPSVLAGIDTQANAYGQASAEYEKAAAQQQRLVEIQSEVVDLGISSLRGLIDGTKDWNDVLSDTLGLLEDILAQQLKTALTGGAGGGGGFLSALFGGGGKKFAGLFAEGGTIPAGKFGIVGERGPEFVQGPATVTPQAGISVKVTANNYGTETNVQPRLNGRELEIMIDTRVRQTLQRSAGTKFGRSVGLNVPLQRA